MTPLLTRSSLRQIVTHFLGEGARADLCNRNHVSAFKRRVTLRTRHDYETTASSATGMMTPADQWKNRFQASSCTLF